VQNVGKEFKYHNAETILQASEEFGLEVQPNKIGNVNMKRHQMA
jgi:hypothetical protein